jgi:hypothetical protein
MESKSLWENLKKGLEQGIKTISEKTEELTEMGRLKLEILSVKRDIEKQFIELGGRSYQILKTDGTARIDQDTPIKELVEKIRMQEKKLDELNLKYENMKKNSPPENEMGR